MHGISYIASQTSKKLTSLVRKLRLISLPLSLSTMKVIFSKAISFFIKHKTSWHKRLIKTDAYIYTVAGIAIQSLSPFWAAGLCKKLANSFYAFFFNDFSFLIVLWCQVEVVHPFITHKEVHKTDSLMTYLQYSWN